MKSTIFGDRHSSTMGNIDPILVSVFSDFLSPISKILLDLQEYKSYTTLFLLKIIQLYSPITPRILKK
jgi:hypothetical protein